MDGISAQRKIRLTRMGHSYWVAARICWQLGLFYPSMSLLSDSVELYLRALFLADKRYKNEAELSAGLRKFSASGKSQHELSSMFEALPIAIRSKLDADGAALVARTFSKYGEGMMTGYGDKPFSRTESLIKQMRTVLGQPMASSHLAEFDRNIYPRTGPNYEKMHSALALILSTRNRPRMSDVFKQIRRRVR